MGVIVWAFAHHVRTDTTTSSTSIVSSEALDSLQKKDASGIDTSHLDNSLIPPTNKWFSGIALQKIPKSVFPTPLSFTPTETSFTIDLPQVETSDKTIFSKASHPTTITIKDAVRYRITRYDELSVDLTYYNSANQGLGTVTLAAGSPYVFYKAARASRTTITSPSPIDMHGKSSLQSSGDKSTFYASSYHGATLTQSGSVTTSSLPPNGLVTFYVLPSHQDPRPLASSAGTRLTGVDVGYRKVKESLITDIRVSTDTKLPTVLGLLPHQTLSTKPAFTLETLYGKQSFVSAATVTFSTPAVPIADSLSLTSLNPSNKAQLVTQLRHDINATQFTAEDTYFAGKQLYRSAQLLHLAKQLQQDDIADTMQRKLHTELSIWLKPNDGRTKKIFYYDTKIHGIVGQTASFGSQEFNDHHFHYGYFIYAATLLARYDKEFKENYTPMVNVLVADIANMKSDDLFPMRRTFDPYFGHSWASGSSPFNDGNNQESISEALNAWTAVGLWAKEVHNEPLYRQAEWMMANEFQSGLSYWLMFDQTAAPYNSSYSRAISPLNWGGKRDYATFFSAEPRALLGILLLPMNPTMVSYDKLKQRIPELLHEAAAGASTPYGPFSDYLLMLESLSGDSDTLGRAKELPDEFVDSANSRSYIYAWIMSRRS